MQYGIVTNACGSQSLPNCNRMQLWHVQLHNDKKTQNYVKQRSFFVQGAIIVHLHIIYMYIVNI